MLDPLPGNNSATDTDRLTPVADLSITKTDGVQSVVPGTLVRYTLVVRNAGPSAVIGALVQDPASPPCRGCGGRVWRRQARAVGRQGTGPIATTVNLAPGGTATFTLTGTWRAATGTLANTATVTPPIGVTDPEPGNNTVTDTNAVLPPRSSARRPAGKRSREGDLPDLEWRVVWLQHRQRGAPRASAGSTRSQPPRPMWTAV